MQHRQITLADGRYLIFYTFDNEAAPPPTDTDNERPEPEPTPEAEEERSV